MKIRIKTVLPLIIILAMLTLPILASAEEISGTEATTNSSETVSPSPSEAAPTPSEAVPTPSEAVPTPSEAVPTPSEEVPSSSPSIVLGDADGDGTVTMADAELASSIAMGTEITSDDMLSRADVDKNGEITLSDARKIARLALDLDDTVQ